MGYCFRYYYIKMALQKIAILEDNIKRSDIGSFERSHFDRHIGIIRRFISYKNSIEKKILSCEVNAYLVGEALGEVADNRLWSVWKRIDLGFCGDTTDLFAPLEEIERMFDARSE